ncbi:MAG: hypothetical protein WDZ62_00445 [Candidatus Pacearchaeota archaeon]
MVNLFKNFKKIGKKTNFRALIYGMFSNWGLIVLSNIIGSIFTNTIGIDLVRKFIPALYLLIGIAFYFPSPKSRDFRIGYILAFVIGLILITLFYYPILIS